MSHMKPYVKPDSNDIHSTYIWKFLPGYTCYMHQYKATKCYYYSVVTKPCDVSFIASVKQNWAVVLVPVLVIDKVPLLEHAILQKPKVIDLWRNRNQNRIKVQCHCMHNVFMDLYLNAYSAIAFI